MSKLKKILIAVLVFVVVSLGLALRYNDMVSFDNPKYYKQAVDFYSKKDYQNAYYNFGKVKKISPLYIAALFKQGVCAEKLGDYGTVIKKYSLLVEKYPKSFFAPKARYSLAKAYFQKKDYENAERYFKNIQEHGFVEDYIIASNYYLGMIEKDSDKNSAKKYFIDYISLSPNGTYAKASADEIVSLAVPLSDKENLILGKLYFSKEKYTLSKKYLEGAEFAYAWPYLALVYAENGKYNSAKFLVEQGLIRGSKKTDREALEQAIDLYVKIYSNEPKQGLFKLSKIIQENKSVGEDYVLFKLAKILKGHDSLNLYSKVAYKYPNSEIAPDALWNLFWHEYENKNYKNAKKLGNEFLRRYPDSDSAPRMYYWMGKTAFAQKKTAEANGYWNKVLSKFPDDYYAFRSESALKGDPNSWGTKSCHKLEDRELNIEFPINYSMLDIKDLKLINTLLDLGDYDTWSELSFNNKFVESWFEYKSGNRSRSALLAREGLASLDVKPPFNDDVYKLAYPTYWVDSINQNSIKSKLDPYLTISLIREESYFNPYSRSSTNAVGLMQIMPSTAVYISQKYNLKVPSVAKLEVPEKNIFYGCMYFKYVKNSLDGNDVLAVASYNGGPNAVKSWQERIKHEDFDQFVENIPYPETRGYVKKVYRSYWNYLNIYKY